MEEPKKKSKYTPEEKSEVLKDFNKLSEFIKSIQDMSEEDFNDNIDLVETYLKVMFTYIQKIDKTGELHKLNEQNAIKKEVRNKDGSIGEKREIIADSSYLKEFKKVLEYIFSEEAKRLGKPQAKFPKIYSHPEIDNIIQNIFRPGSLTFQGKFFSDEEENETQGLAIWENQGIEYHIKLDDLPKLQGKDPKVFVSQMKNIDLLMLLAQEQNFNSPVKEANCDFTLTEYAERRGYTKEEIKRGGGFLEELKRDLFTGAYLTYRIDKIKIEGKNYIAHGIPNFYTLFEPIDSKTWKVVFNDPYKSWLMQILEGNSRQYFIKDRQAIEDRTTTEKPYLFLFYRQLVQRRQHNLLTKPVKILSLLEKMKLPEKILKRPKESFMILKECLIYFSQNYKPTPVIESFKIYSDFHKTKEAVRLPLGITEAFKEYSYEDFKDLLIAIGIKDLREAYISFKRPQGKRKKSNILDEEEQALLEKTLKWFNDPYNPNNVKIPIEDQESLVKRYIKKIGKERYRTLFEKEANKPYGANSVIFLTKTLKEYGSKNPSYSEGTIKTKSGIKINYGKKIEKL